MPHLTLQVLQGGPLVDLYAGPSEPKIAALRAANAAMPAFQKIRALIDTGASCTRIDPTCLTALGLSATGSAPIHTPTTGNTPQTCDQYDVQLVLLHANGQHLRIPTMPVIASNLSLQGIQALIGRDVLAKCLFVYDGAANIFSLAF